MKILINGSEQECVSVFDRGFSYGDGLFETIRITHGSIPLLELHLDRLRNSCIRLSIRYPGDNIFRQEAFALSQLYPEAILKIVLTRGVSTRRGYTPYHDSDSTRILIVSEYAGDATVYAKQGIDTLLCQHRLSRNQALAGMKHLSMLEYVLAAAEMQSRPVQEGIVCDTENYVIEGTRTNLFLVSNDCLYTPDLSYAGVAGVMRNKLLSIASMLGIKTEIRCFDISMFTIATEVFVSNSTIGVWPVRRINDMTFQIGGITRQLQQAVSKIFASGSHA